MTLTLANTNSLSAASIESLVMPGEVIEAHGDVETECSSCHAVFARYSQRALCIDCHEDIGADINGASGFHGLFEKARDDDCASCHTDHEGRNAQIAALDRHSFDHDLTDFRLLGEHRDVVCNDCHEPGQKFREAEGKCVSCHRDDDIHRDSLGSECESCHRETGWQDVRFDHDATGYPLLGKHVDTACGDCHEDRKTYQNTPLTCYGCHASDDAHDGRSGKECETCHNPFSWTETSFDHDRDTQFALDGSHGELECNDCHSENPFADALATGCNSCHAEDDPHEGEEGVECQDCHNTISWEEDVFFDHDLARFPLLGMHAEAECDSCHETQVFRQAPDTCVDCHRDDDPHEDRYFDDCASCHNPVDWLEWSFDHDQETDFPLTGAHVEVTCESCHRQSLLVMSRLSGRCGDCHRADDIHDGEFGFACGRCHTANSFREVKAIQ